MISSAFAALSAIDVELGTTNPNEPCIRGCLQLLLCISTATTLSLSPRAAQSRLGSHYVAFTVNVHVSVALTLLLVLASTF